MYRLVYVVILIVLPPSVRDPSRKNQTTIWLQVEVAEMLAMDPAAEVGVVEAMETALKVAMPIWTPHCRPLANH